MSADPGPAASAASPVGLVREVIALGVAALVTRGELAALELAEARDQAARWLALAIVAATLLLAALLVAALFVVSVFWDTHRSEAIAVVALAYGVIGGVLAAWLLARVRNAPPLLEVTLAELKKDCAALGGRTLP